MNLRNITFDELALEGDYNLDESRTHEEWVRFFSYEYGAKLWLIWHDLSKMMEDEPLYGGFFSDIPEELLALVYVFSFSDEEEATAVDSKQITLEEWLQNPEHLALAVEEGVLRSIRASILDKLHAVDIDNFKRYIENLKDKL